MQEKLIEIPIEAAELCKQELGISLPSPLRDRCVIMQHVPWHFFTDNGIEVNHGENSMPRIYGIVLVVGDRVHEVEYGDFIRFVRYSEEALESRPQWEGRDLSIIHIKDIEAVFPPEDLLDDVVRSPIYLNSARTA